jgi:hypothetical protein
VLQKYEKEDVILFPAGFYYIPGLDLDSVETNDMINDIRNLLKNSKPIVCLGIDAGKNSDDAAGRNKQIAVVISKSRIIAKGRESMNDGELTGEDRFFECKKKQFYLAVCYDVFRVRRYTKKNAVSTKINAILNPVYFNPTREKVDSDYSRYIRNGYGVASMHWDCPVFGAAIFFERKVPDNWRSLSGFKCEGVFPDLRRIKYADNTVKHHDELNNDISEKDVVCCSYTIPN